MPSGDQDRYRDLLRVSRQWNDLHLRKRSGIGHDPASPGITRPGGLALFCPACPQPGINLPENWKTLPDQWRFRRAFVGDGNFKAELHKGVWDKDIFLNQGLGYMVGQQYQEHLEATSKVIQEVFIIVQIQDTSVSLTLAEIPLQQPQSSEPI